MMPVPFPPQAAAIFVCRSPVPLAAVCHALQQHYGLPNFAFDEHSTWEYAASMRPEIGFNVTKTHRFGTIQQWMADAPRDVNYQLIVYLADASERRMTHVKHQNDVSLAAIGAYLRDVLQADGLFIGGPQP